MRAKQFLYFFTRPLAKLIYLFDTERRNALKNRREIIKIINKRSYVDFVANLLYEQSKILQVAFSGPVLRMNCIIEAEKMFNEKKKHGDFDELNTLIK